MEKVDVSPEKSNVFCRNSQNEILWFAEIAFHDDFYPNQILLNHRINKLAKNENEYFIEDKNFISSYSQKSICVSIELKTGKIVESQLTK